VDIGTEREFGGVVMMEQVSTSFPSGFFQCVKPLVEFTTKAWLEVLDKVSNDQHAPTNRNRVFGDGECSVA
jgi:hypothetical protein